MRYNSSRGRLFQQAQREPDDWIAQQFVGGLVLTRSGLDETMAMVPDTDPIAAAKSAGLRYVGDGMPGIRKGMKNAAPLKSRALRFAPCSASLSMRLAKQGEEKSCKRRGRFLRPMSQEIQQ